MKTIFTKEIERLEKDLDIKEWKMYLDKGASDYGTTSLSDKDCSEVLEIINSLQEALKQAEQKHLEFVEELKKKIEEAVFYDEIPLLRLIDKLAGDELK